MAASRPSEWMMHPGLVFKTFEDSLIKSPFGYNTPHIVPEKILESFVDQSGIRCYRVKWLDSWLTEQHVSTAFPHLITEYWISKPINDATDYQAYTAPARTTLASLSLTGLSTTKGTKPNGKSQADTLHHISPQPSTIMSIPQLFSNDHSKQSQNISSNLMNQKNVTETDFIVGESLKLPEKLNMKVSDIRKSEEKNQLQQAKTDNIILLFDKSSSLLELPVMKEKEKNTFGNKSLAGTVLSTNYENQLHQYVNQIPLPSMEQINQQQGISSQLQQDGNINSDNKKGFPKKVITKQPKLLKDKQPVTCDICGKSISSRKNLRVHKTVKHFKNGNFACNVCGRKFALNRDLKRHMPLHTNERNYICPYCGLQCKQPGHLTKHIRTHTEVMNWRCDCCFKNFRVQADLKEHCFTEHADIKDKNLTCSVCKEKLKLPNSVYLHSLRHSGVREFECKICKATFKLKQHMQVHMKTHERSKEVEKYTCLICNREFRFKHMYEKHKSKHTENTAEEYQENLRLKEEQKRSKVLNRRSSGRNRQSLEEKDVEESQDSSSDTENLPKRKRRKPSKVLYDEDLKTKKLVRKKFENRDLPCPQCDDVFRSKSLLNSHLKLHKLEMQKDTIEMSKVGSKKCSGDVDALNLPAETVGLDGMKEMNAVEKHDSAINNSREVNEVVPDREYEVSKSSDGQQQSPSTPSINLANQHPHISVLTLLNGTNISKPIAESSKVETTPVSSGTEVSTATVDSSTFHSAFMAAAAAAAGTTNNSNSAPVTQISSTLMDPVRSLENSYSMNDFMTSSAMAPLRLLENSGGNDRTVESAAATLAQFTNIIRASGSENSSSINENIVQNMALIPEADSM